MSEVVYAAGEPRPSALQSAKRSKKKRRRAEKPYRYPTREELEGNSKKNGIAKKLDEVRAAEERTLLRYNELKRAETMEDQRVSNGDTACSTYHDSPQVMTLDESDANEMVRVIHVLDPF